MKKRSITGNIDTYKSGRIYGWAMDMSEPEKHLEVDVYADSVKIGSVIADSYREDLAKANIGKGDHAFSFLIPIDKVGVCQELDFIVRETGQVCHNSPFNLSRIVVPHKERLQSILKGHPFEVFSMQFDGENIQLCGYALPIDGDPQRTAFSVNDMPVSDVKYPIEDKVRGERYWFWPNSEKCQFVLNINLNDLPATSNNYYQLSIFDKKSICSIDNIYTIYLPGDLNAFHTVPDSERQKRVVGWADNSHFIISGYIHFRRYKALFDKHAKVPWSEVQTILDWGCGCGRTIRHFLRENGNHKKIFGVDIDKDNIEWCSNNLKNGNFFPTELRPPLPFDDESFDFIYGTSVFTHLREKEQFHWLDELRRVLKPNGFIIVTIHGDSAVAHGGRSLDWIEKWEKQGFLARSVNRDLEGFISEEDYYRNTFHTKKYIHNEWSKYFPYCVIVDRVFGYQDAVMLAKS